MTYTRPLDSPYRRGEIRTMGFNRRKMEAQRAAAAEKEAAAKWGPFSPQRRS